MALHEVQLKGYSVRPGNLSLGTFDSYGIEQLHVTLDDMWSGLAVTATVNPPKGEPVEIRVPENGLIDVPAEATANEGTGAIVYCGVANGVQLITKTQGYNVITHGNVGGTAPFNPSESLATQVLQAALNAEKNSAEANTAAQSAQTAAESAAVAAKASAESASKAAAEAAAAKPYSESAKSSAEAARNSENQAQQSSAEANTAKNAAQNAQAGAESSATAAAKSAKEAAASAVNLDSAANTATQKAAAASASAEAAKASESAAASSEAAARKYANSAELAAKTAGEAAAEKLQQMQAIQDDVTAKQAQTATDATAAEKAKVAAEAAQNGAAASETAAADSAAAAKASEDAAAKSAADADSTANSIKKRQNVLVGSETGNPIAVDDAFAAPLCGLTVYGRSTQDGTPTPDAPVPIVSAGDSGSVAVKVTGKNLLYLPDGSKLSRGITVTAKDGLISISGTATSTGYADLDIKPFIASGVMILSSSNASPRARLVSQTWNVVLDSSTADKMSDMATRIVFVVTEGQTYNLTSVKVQLELGTTATAYSPYREQLLTLPTPNGLPGIPVTSGGNYTDQSGQQWVCDEVDLERGVKVQRVDKAAFDSTKTLVEQNAILTTPIETTLTPAEIAAYKALTAYAPDTVVQASDGAGIKLDYQRDVNLVIKNLEDAIASMTTT